MALDRSVTASQQSMLSVVACSSAGVKGSCIRFNRHRISDVKCMPSNLETENPS